MGDQPTWVLESCTLPIVDRPLRVAEFDEVFTMALRAIERVEATHLRLVLDPSVEARARDVTEREAACCSFFTFTLTLCGDDLHLDVQVHTAHTDVLDAFSARAAISRRAST